MFHQKELQLLEKILIIQEKTYLLINDRFPIMHIKFYVKHKHHLHERRLDMDLTLVNSPTAGALGVPVETKADGTVFQFDPAQIVWSVQDPSVLSFTQNADGTAQFKPVGVGTTQIAVVDQATQATKIVQGTVTPGVQPNTMDINFTNVTQ